jgi:diadenosine tetraphosphatase ApaH/serine/threonine PP2A family protein phosphatase
VHGSPRDPIWEYVISPSIAAINFSAFETRLCLFGHTHIPIVFHADDRRVRVVPAIPGEPVTLDAGRAMINPGSVGQPRDGDPAAAYMVLDTEHGSAEFRRVSYDVDRTQRLMREADLPPRLAERLSYGR